LYSIKKKQDEQPHQNVEKMACRELILYESSMHLKEQEMGKKVPCIILGILHFRYNKNERPTEASMTA
jgi:hypothetical protein